ncbi:hypothetical protein [Leadbettera azotonutricia]|uniref:Capsule assembly Wzi family protein n=1 Tax=Leadbettera azotonutricia (strain ATCC BAA-888 / DSM 13862 / ZAS-9) TaxID=545695 RepID=F5YAU3_LEAAZ|nr:hypothetical protein [Leadbettera azotonutricia]AEF82021.1 conserved hypothetical protein [Leadbettera azotonutricia ZAS-9]
MKRLIIAALLAFLFLSALGAQFIHDPNDPIYKDIDRWAVRRYIISALPLIRPYPAQVLDDLLSQVIENGNQEARDKAAIYKNNIAPGNRMIHAGVKGNIVSLNDDLTAEGAFFADGSIRLRDWIGASYSMFIYGATKKPGTEYTVPGTYSPFPDLVSDTANIGPFNLFQDWTSTLGIGTHNFFFQAGLNRTSVGPFYDNGTVVGPQAARAGHFSLNYRHPKFSFEMLMLAITASDDLNEKLFPQKFLIFHSFNFNPLPNLEFGYLESVVWGGRFEFLYIVPFTNLFGAQSLTGDFEDNSFMGFHVRWYAPHNLQFLTQVYIDDMHLNDLMRFKFNTKLKFAGEFGLTWAPEEGPLASLTGNYTMVFPYMYTHWNHPDEYRYSDKPNYLNYSHMGRNLGTDLLPNSDRLALKAVWRTHPDFDINMSAYFTRHGNASEPLPPGSYYDGDPNSISPDDRDEYHNGDIFDDGDTIEGNNYSKVHFLTQDTIDTRLAGGLGIKWTLPSVAIKVGVLSFNIDYVFEYGWNRGGEYGPVKNNNGISHYWSMGGAWRW